MTSAMASPLVPGERGVPDVVGVVMHEIRAPLATMRVTLDLLAEIVSTECVSASPLVTRLQQTIAWLESIAESCLAWWASGHGAAPIPVQPVPVFEVIERSIALLQPMLDRKNQRVDLLVLTSLSGARIDGRVLRQVLVNLLMNASKHGVAGDVIEVAVSVDTTWLLVRVTDHGPGIPPDEQPVVFEHFRRGALAVERGVEGFGLGLSIARLLVEMSGGTIGLESRPGAGTSFWFQLPIDPTVERSTAAQAESNQLQGDANEGLARRR
jgi:signal transduction histidine kinase